MTKACLKHFMDSKAVSVIFAIPKIGHKEKNDPAIPWCDTNPLNTFVLDFVGFVLLN
jgi:hypothetical protein